MVQISHPYMTTGKTIALAIRTFVCKMMSLLLNMQCRFIIAFLPRSKCLLISWLQSPSEVILELKKIKSVILSTVSPSICHEVTGPDAIKGFPVLHCLPEFAHTHVHWVSDAIQPPHPLLSHSPLALNLSQNFASKVWC